MKIIWRCGSLGACRRRPHRVGLEDTGDPGDTGERSRPLSRQTGKLFDEVDLSLMELVLCLAVWLLAASQCFILQSGDVPVIEWDRLALEGSYEL